LQQQPNTENVTGGVLERKPLEGAEGNSLPLRRTASVDSLGDQFTTKITSAPLSSVVSRLIFLNLFIFTDNKSFSSHALIFEFSIF
jgi:hypothetical protein